MSEARESYGGATESYVGAPYNFVPFSDMILTRYANKSELPGHDRFVPGTLTGEISCTLTTKTPVFVSDGNNDFFRGANGQYLIPGSTVRGMVRTNMQILGYGAIRPNDDLQDYTLMFRQVNDTKGWYASKMGVRFFPTSGSEKQASLPGRVNAGYLHHLENDEYQIYPAQPIPGALTYYAIREDTILREVKDAEKQGRPNPFQYLIQREFQQEGCKLQHTGGFRAQSIRGRWHITGQRNGLFESCQLEISYELGGLSGSITAIGRKGKYSHNGWLTLVGKMQEHKLIYVFPEEDTTAVPIGVSKASIVNYKADFEAKQNGLKPKEFWELPQRGEVKPVFYLDGGQEFGFSPFIRIFYAHSIAEGLPKCHRQCKDAIVLDYPNAVLGYADKENSYRSRVSFGDFAVDEGTEPGNPERALLAGPKPSSYLDYLEGGKTYQADDLSLRGFKQYWLKKVQPAGNTDKEKVVTYMRPIQARFTGKIRFRNLTADELGLLLWCLRLEEGCYQSIGMGKPYGYGCVEVAIQRLQLLHPEERYTPAAFLNGSPAMEDCTATIQEYIDAYRQYANDALQLGCGNKPSIEKQGRIKDFFYIHRAFADTDERAARFRYMMIGDKGKGRDNEFQQRKKHADGGVLPKLETYRKETEGVEPVKSQSMEDALARLMQKNSGISTASKGAKGAKGKKKR